MTYQLNQRVIIKKTRRQGIIKEQYLAKLWRVELLNGTEGLFNESELKPMPEKKEKKGKLVGVCNCDCHCHINCFTDHEKSCKHCEKVEKQSEPKGFKEENEITITKEFFEQSLTEMYDLGREHGVDSGIRLTNFIRDIKNQSNSEEIS